jgi:protocatechuate 3,4-dioxygenase beta subunit
MNNLKSVLFYILGLAGLVAVSVILTGQIEADISPLPSRTPRPTPIADQACPPTPGNLAYGFLGDSPLTNSLAPPDFIGQRLYIFGTVYASDCLTPLTNALIEVWQANSQGAYNRSELFILRGQTRTDAQGRYQFLTIRPGHYTDEDTPWPAYFHLRITYQGYKPLATRILFADDPYLADGLSREPPLIVSLTEIPGTDKLHLGGKFDIILPIAPSTPSSEEKTD